MPSTNAKTLEESKSPQKQPVSEAEPWAADDESGSESDGEVSAATPSESGPSRPTSKKKKKKRSKVARVIDALKGDSVPQAVVDQVVAKVKEEHGENSATADEETVREVLRQLKLKDVAEGKAGFGGKNRKDTGDHKFWATQPVPHYDDGAPDEDGYIEASKPREEVRQDAFPLPKDFEWSFIDILDPAQLKEVYELLSANYVEDEQAAFRFRYTWSGWQKEWHLGVRVSSNKKFVAFIWCSYIPPHSKCVRLFRPFHLPRAQTAFDDKGKSMEVRLSNLVAAKAISDAVRTSLGPRGIDKMIQTSKGEVIVTNNGATILRSIQALHPASKMLVDLSAAQDIEAGDGTTSVVVLAGSLLSAAEKMLQKGIHPTIIAESFLRASEKAVEFLTEISTPIDLNDHSTPIRAASTSLNSKIVSQYSSILAPISVSAVTRLVTPASSNVDLRDIRIVKRVGGTIEDTELIGGVVLNQNVAVAAGGPTRIEKALSWQDRHRYTSRHGSRFVLQYPFHPFRGLGGGSGGSGVPA